MKKTELYDYGVISVDIILKIHKYLTKKHNIV